MNTVEKLKQIIREELGQDREITPETTLEDLGLDSLEFVALMQAIGRELGEIPEERWKDLRTVGDIANFYTTEDAEEIQQQKRFLLAVCAEL